MSQIIVTHSLSVHVFHLYYVWIL